MESNYPNLSICSLNVNSLNVSSFKEGGCKTMEKIVAVMRRKCDIIILIDCRLKGSAEKVKKVFRVGKNLQYDLYVNSSRSERGVCIALNRNRTFVVNEEIKDFHDENYLMLRCTLEGKEFVIGGIYGPNTNNVGFYRSLKNKVENLNLPFILGGDFNTVIDGGLGEENLDLEDRNHIPQRENGKFIRDWIGKETYVTPLGTNIQWRE